MRRAAGVGLLAFAAWGLPTAQAQTLPVPTSSPRPDSVKTPLPTSSPQPDSVKTPLPTCVADTARHVTVVTAEPPEVVTRPLALRIGAAIVVLTLTT